MNEQPRGRFIYFSDPDGNTWAYQQIVPPSEHRRRGGTDQTDPESVRELIASVTPPVLNPYPVSKSVNIVRNNGPELLAPVRT